MPFHTYFLLTHTPPITIFHSKAYSLKALRKTVMIFWKALIDEPKYLAKAITVAGREGL
jgi:hypothetical protein